MLQKKAEEQINRLLEKINYNDPKILSAYPIENYISELEKYPKTAHYRFISKRVKSICQNIITLSNQEILELYHMLLLSKLIKASIKIDRISKYPQKIQTLIKRDFEKILNRISRYNTCTGHYLYENDKFYKDLAISQVKMIPLGAEKVSIGRLSRVFPFKGGIKQFLLGSKIILLDMKGFEPVFHIHMDTKDTDLLKEFNPKGWYNFYLLLAELLKMDKSIKGATGTSWFFDPALKNISPELNYLREIALQCGAHIFYMDQNESAISKATFMSKKRLEMYKNGSYTPTNYITVIPREKLLKWASRNN